MLDFLSIILFRNAQEMCFYSCQITSLCSFLQHYAHQKHVLQCIQEKVVHDYYKKTFASVAEFNFLGV